MLIFFWEMRAKNRATMSILGYFWSILDLIFVANFVGKWVSVNFYVFCDCAGGGPLFCDGINYDLVKS